MPKKATKAAGNVFYEARMEASTWNDKLASREGAAEETGLDRTRLAYIELGTINPHPEEVLILSDTYNAPELLNHFCSRMCALGVHTVRPVQLQELERSTLQLLSALGGIAALKENLVNICADGVIDEVERPQMEDVLKRLDDTAASIEALKLYYRKQFGNRTN
nr:MAG TPA: regulatory protein [Caudoviricetes sp.]